MSKAKKAGMIILLSVLFASIGCTAFTLLAEKGSAEEPVWSVSETAENAFDKEKTYLVGDEIAIPEKTVTVGQETYSTQHILIFPDKKAYIDDLITLSAQGKYVLQYTAVGADYTEETEFLVNSPLYSVGSANSFAVTGAAADYTDYAADGKSGIITSVALGDTFEYHKIIDLTGKEADDTIVNFSVLPERVGTADCMRIEFVFTDIYDESNSVTVVAKMCGTGIAWREQATYVTANAVGQPETGLEPKSTGSFVWNGQNYNLYQNNALYGAYAVFSLSGMPHYNEGIEANRPNVGEQELRFSFDYAERRVYCNGAIVADLDDPTIFTDLWNGFSTGEVKLSIRGDSYNSSALNLLINEIDGDTEFSDTFVEDTAAPVITVENALEGVYAVVGKAFQIPAAKANDGSAVTVDVYKNYGMGTQTMVDVTFDWTFIPDQTREYAIVYTASDESGNTAREILKVTAVKDKSVSLVCEGDGLAGVVGQLKKVAKPEVLDASGSYTVSIDAVSEAAEYHIGTYTDKELGSGAALVFRPLYAGNYKIVYTVADYVSEYETSYDLTVAPNGGEVFLQEPVLPRYILKNAVYETPSLTGTYFENGAPAEKPANVYITNSPDIAGAEPYTRNIFQITEDRCYVTFVLGEAVLQREIKVVDVGFGTNNVNFAEYFIGVGDSGISFSEVRNGNLVVGLEYEVNSAQKTPAIDMANHIQVYGFAVEFTVPENPGYEAFTITLTDTKNAGNALNIEFVVENGEVKLLSDTGIKYTACAAGERVVLSYNDAERAITLNSQKIAVNLGANGSEWAGFAKKTAYFTVSFAETEKARIILNNLNNQPVRITASDTIAPQISASSESGTRGLNAIVPLDALFAADVLTPRISFVMNVTDPDGNTVTAEDGTLLNVSADPGKAYTIKLEKYGLYMITYTAVDAAGMQRVYEYTFRAVDDIAPTIVLEDHTESANVGDSVVVANAQISDNVSAAGNCTQYITVQLPNGAILKLGENSNSFRASVAGTYTVTYMVSDEAGNVGYASYEVVVS